MHTPAKEEKEYKTREPYNSRPEATTQAARPPSKPPDPHPLPAPTATGSLPTDQAAVSNRNSTTAGQTAPKKPFPIAAEHARRPKNRQNLKHPSTKTLPNLSMKPQQTPTVIICTPVGIPNPTSSPYLSKHARGFQHHS